MTVYDATSIEAAAKVAEEYPSREWADIPIIQGIAKAIRAVPVSPVPTTGEASESPPLSELHGHAGVGHAPGSATDGGSDAIGETVEKLRAALEDRTRVACGDWCTEDRHDAGCIAAHALLTALEQRGDGERVADMWWDPNDPERPLDHPFEDIGDWGRDYGVVHELWQGARLPSIYIAALPAAEDSESDDDWTFEGASEADAKAALDAEIARRSDPTPPLPMKED